MFIGRDYEISTLNNLYAENKFQLAIIYGRRRVGKTTLLTKFIENKASIFFSASESSDKINLEHFSREVLTFFGTLDTMSKFDSWETAFRYIAREAVERQIVLVIDEFPYLSESNSSLMSTMQNIIDHQLKNGRLFLVLCGSYMSFMEREVLGYKSPLFGRRTSQLKIEPFDYYDSSKFYPNYNSIDKIVAYGIFGGTPHYLAKIDPKLSISDNISKCFLDRSAYLYDEPTAILKQELREPAMYNSIIEAIANGASKLNEIGTKVGEDGNKCGKYIKSLIELGFLAKEQPYGADKNSHKTVYSISDNLFKFWYKFIFTNQSMIEAGMSKVVLEQIIIPNLETYIGHTFENVCKEFLWRENKAGRLPIFFERAVRFWGTDSRKREQFEIDIVAGRKGEAIFCECKWRNETVKSSVLRDLMDKSNNLAVEKKYYALFSKRGFSIDDPNILLFTPDALYRATE